MRCEDCGLLYLNPRPTRSEMGRYYPAQYFGPPSPPRRFSRVKRWILQDFYGYPEIASPGYRRYLRKLLLWPEYIRRVITGRESLPWVGRGRLLDVGCGSGVSTAIYKEQGWNVSGLDLNEVAVRYARTLLGNRVQLGDLMSVRYPDRAFDLVRLSHSLEHMYGLGQVLAVVGRILDDGGVLAVTVPNAGSWEAKIFRRWWYPWELPRHLHHFERATIGDLLQRAGFRVIRMQTGVTAAHFMTSLERVWAHGLGRALPARRMVEKLLARPFCLLAGNLGYGTEITVYAVKLATHEMGDN